MLNMSDRHISWYSTVHKTSINNMMPNSKFSNKEILWFNLWITTNFNLTCPKIWFTITSKYVSPEKFELGGT